ncbi:MAG: PAS domain S-box protein, partial [Thermosynechococcaceae cyanobacterium]
VVRLSAQGKSLDTLLISQAMTRPVITVQESACTDIFFIANLLQQHNIRHVPVLDEQDRIAGLLTHENLRQITGPADLLRLRLVAEAMTKAVICANPQDSMKEIAKLMTAHRVSTVVIVQEPPSGQGNPIPVGMITERDIVQFQALGLPLAMVRAAAVMSTPVFSVSPEDSLWTVHQTMTQRLIGRLAVTGSDGELLGIVTQTSLLRVLNPVELYTLTEILEQKVSELEAEKIKLLEVRAMDLELQVEQANAYQRMQIQLVEQQRTELDLRKSEQFYAALANVSPVGIFCTDASGLCTYVNERWCQISGLQRSEAEGFGWMKGLHPSERERVSDEWAISLETHRPFRLEYRFQSSEGQATWVYGQAAPELGVAGEIVGYVGTITDISERKLGEQKIREQASLLDVATDAIILRDLKGRIQYWNRGAERIYGWSAPEILNLEVLPNFNQSFTDAMETVLEIGEWEGEVVKHTKSGREIIVQSRCTLILDEMGQAKSILSVENDITDKKLLEKQFLRAQRLESLGTLSSGIAHDLNNIFTPIMAATQLLPLKNTKLDERSQRLLGLLQESAQRGSSLVKQILSFVKGLDGQRSLLQVGHLLSEIVNIARETFPKNIDIELSMSTRELWMVQGDATQLHQVFMNLCVNARDAMSAGGILKLTAENVEIDENYVRMNLEARTGSYIVVTAEDTGIGISPEDIELIFDPFFSTKPKEQGTGLGLSTVLGIVKSHGGFLTVYSEVGKGSCFKAYLPAIKVNEEQEQEESSYDLMGQGELVLIVDDEASIREITKISLEAFNYRTVTAIDGIEAIATYAKHLDEIRFVLLDLMMPSLDSATVIQTLKCINPSAHIIAMSGLSSNDRLPPQDVEAFLAKPFTAKALLETLHQLNASTALASPVE